MLETLESVRVDTLRINRLEERIQRLRSAMERMTPLPPDSQPGGSPEQDKMAAQMAQIDELERELVDRLIKLEEKLKKVDKMLDRLPSRQRAIVHMRLVEALPWRVISRRAHYSERHSRRLFRRAVDAYLANMENVSRNVRF